MSEERYQAYKGCTTFEEVDKACVTPLVYKYALHNTGKVDTVMRKADLVHDLLHGFLIIRDQEGNQVSACVAARAHMVRAPSREEVAAARAHRLAGPSRKEVADELKKQMEGKWSPPRKRAEAVLKLIKEGVIEEPAPSELRRLRDEAMYDGTASWCGSTQAAQSAARASSDSGNLPTWLALAMRANVTVVVDGMVEPISLRDATRLPEWPLWKEAVQKEIQGIILMGVWDEIPRSQVPSGRRVVPSHFVLKIKTEERNGELVFVKCKARLCYDGHRSVGGIDYHETASYVASAKSIRTLLAIAASRDYKVVSFDIKQAFLYASVPEDTELYMELPPLLDADGQPNPSGYQECGRGKCASHVAKLKRMLYGAKDAPRLWAEVMTDFMGSLPGEAKTIATDRMVYRWEWNGEEMNCAIHVDDIVATPSSESIRAEFERRLKERFGEEHVTGGTETPRLHRSRSGPLFALT